MALVIEDGTGVVGATSYASLVDFRAFMTARGYILTDPEGIVIDTNDTKLEALLIQAIDYLESFRDRYKGSKTTVTQALQWPRMNVTIDNSEIPNVEIPTLLKNAQCQIAIETCNNDPMATNTGPAISEEKVDVLQVKYAVAPGSRPLTPSMPKVDAFLAPLLKSTPVLRLVRI